jgi:hypothetical protein
MMLSRRFFSYSLTPARDTCYGIATVEDNMVASYQMNASELTVNFLKAIQDMFGNQEITVRIKTKDELKREGWVVPKGEEDDPFYSVANLQHLNASIKQFERGEVVRKTFAELGIDE